MDRLECEFAFISCLLSKPDLIVFVAGKIKPDYFKSESCKSIFEEMINQDTFCLPSLIKPLQNKVSFRDLIKIQSGISLPTQNLVESYAKFIIEEYKERAIKEIDLEKVEDIQSKLDYIKSINFEEDKKDISENFLRGLERELNGLPDLENVETGFSNIDDKIQGFRNCEFVVIGARPAMGKSTIAMNIAYNMAIKGNYIKYYSLEMSEEDLHKRLVKYIHNITSFKGNQSMFNDFANTSRMIQNELKISINDKAGITIEELSFECKKEKKLKRLDAVFIDHLSILKSSKNISRRLDELSEITRQLKVLAKELKVPVICLCQLNRGIENREIKLPCLMDLRDSGTIEQDADVVCFIHRPEYYLDQQGVDHESEEFREVKNKAYFIVSKNRRGRVGNIQIGCNIEVPTFYDI